MRGQESHTGGDVVVYLPKERVVCTGDMLVAGISNLSDGYVNEWPDTLEKLRALDFTEVVPGHGEPWKGKEKIDHWQAYLRDVQPPTLVVWGKHDPSFTVAGAVAYGEDLPEAEVHLLDAGHF